MPDQGPRFTQSVTTTTRRTLKMPVSQLTRFDELKAKYRISESADIKIEIPGGGDWSGERVSADELDCVVSWEETTHVDG